MMKKELEKRLIDFFVSICLLYNELKDYYPSKLLLEQLLRSSSSAALNYGEAQAAESRNDFKHKISIVLKELRESQINIKMLTEIKQSDQLLKLLTESTELVAIFTKTIFSLKNN